MRTRTRATVLVAFLAFISLGLPDGVFGVAWPSIRATFGLPLDAIGALAISGVSGYFLSSSTSGRILSRIGVGTLLAISCLATATALLGYAAAPNWWTMVGLAFVSGLGGGAIDAGLNTYVATNYSARVMNWLHACFGVGATLGPLIMTAVLGAGLVWRFGYLFVGLAQLVLATVFMLSRGWWAAQQAPDGASYTPAVPRASSRSTLRLPVTWISMAVFVMYTGLELVPGQWAYSLFTEARGVPPTTAGLWLSVYWGSLTVGRVLIGFVADRIAPGTLLRGCTLLVVAGAVLIWGNWLPALNFVGLALMGLALAPIFPTLIASTPARLGPAHTPNAVGFQVAAATLGFALIPGLVGILATRFGLEVIGPVMAGCALLLLVLLETLGAFAVEGPRSKVQGQVFVADDSNAISKESVSNEDETAALDTVP